MASFDFDAPEDLDDGGAFLKEVGIYHFAVQSVSEGTGPKGNAIDGFSITAEVLGGTVASEKGKTINFTYFNPKLNDSDKAIAMKKKQRAKLFIALNLLNPSDKGKSVKIELEKAVRQQFVAALEIDEYNSKDGKRYLQIANAECDIWHVDDPHCSGIPKLEGALKIIPAELRHKSEWFEQIYKKTTTAPAATSDNGGKTKAAPAKQPATAAAAAPASRVNLDDL